MPKDFVLTPPPAENLNIRAGIHFSDLLTNSEIGSLNKPTNSGVRHLLSKFYSELTVYDFTIIAASFVFNSLSEVNCYDILHKRYIGLQSGTWKPE